MTITSLVLMMCDAVAIAMYFAWNSFGGLYRMYSSSTGW